MMRKRISLCLAAKFFVYICTAAALIFMGTMVFSVLIHGLPFVSAELFSPHYTPENLSMLPAIINTVSITLIALGIAAPLGTAAAVYLCEYADEKNAAVRIIRLSTEVLSGVPSIVYAVFGMAFLVRCVGLGYSLLSGGITLAVMILPTVIATAEESLQALPDGLREGGLGLGASKAYVIFRLLLPAAADGILNGIILSAGRIAAETAALIFTAGTAAQIASPLHSGRTIAVHIYALCCEGLNKEKTLACAAVLMAGILVLNLVLSSAFSRIFRAGRQHRQNDSL